MKNPGDPLGLGRSLPHSQESERAVLAAFLLDPEKLGQFPFSRRDFYFERHQILYRAMADLFDQAGAAGVDLRTIQAHLQARQDWQAAGGLAYLSGLDWDLPDLTRISQYVAIVRQLSATRQLITESQRVVLGLLDGEFSADAGRPAALVACEHLEAVVQQVGVRLERRPPVRLVDAVDEVLEQAMEQAGSGDSMVGIRTGLVDLDRHTLGLGPGELVTLAASPGVGKTALALQIAAHVAIHEGQPAAVLSLEMDEIQLARRILAAESDISHSAIRSGSLSRSEWQELVKTQGRLAESPLLLRYPTDNSLPRITSDARAMAAEHGGLSLLVIDYLQLMSAGGGRNRNLELATITRSLHRLAGELRAPVLLLSQLSRDHIRNNRPPGLSDLKDSGAIEADSEKVLFLYREPTEQPEPGEGTQIDLLCRKDRHGPSNFDLQLHFEGDKMRFRCDQPEAF